MLDEDKYEFFKIVLVYGVLSTEHWLCVNSCCVSVGQCGFF